jgi:AcrR family transcriptional regulator
MYINSQATQSPAGASPSERSGPLSRQESQALTRQRLLDSAAALFARQGIAPTTIKEIAIGAGHTRGAFYAHFDSKDELCLEMLEQRFGDYLERFSATLAGDAEPAERARRAGDQITSMLRSDPEWHRLSFEFAGYAAHDEQFRRELVKRYRSLRAGVAEVFRVRAQESGVVSPIPLERLTLMTFAISTGMATGMLLEPDAFSEELHGELLAILFAGLQNLAD